MLREALARLSRHTLVYAIAGQLSKVVGFLLIPFYTSYLTRGDYGVNELLTQLIAVLSYVAGINMTAGMSRLYFEQKTPREQKAVISTTLLSLAAASLLLVGALASGARWLAPLVIRDAGAAAAGGLDAAGASSAAIGDVDGMLLLFRLTLAILVLQTVREVFFRYLQVQERSTLFSVLSVGKVVLEVSLQVWFVAGRGLGLTGVFYGVLLGEAASVAVTALLLLPSVGLAFSGPLFRQLARFTLPLIPNGLFMFCLHSGDRFVLKALAGSEALGVYGFAYKFGSIPMMFPLTPFLLVWWPYVFSIRDEEQRRLIIGRVLPYFMFVMTALVFGLALAAQELTRLMEGQPGYAAAWLAVPVVCAGYWCWSCFQIVQTGFYVQKSTGLLPWLSGTAAAVNIGANLLLVPRIGVMGAAWATLGTFALLLVATARAVRPVYPVDWPWRRTIVPAAAAAALFAASLAIGPVTGLGPGPGALAVKLGLFLAWAAWMWKGGFLGGGERAAVRETLAGWRSRLGRRI